MELSILALPEDQRHRFAELAVFPSDDQVPEAAALTLWGYTGGLGERHARRLLRHLKLRSLVRLDQTWPEGSASVSLHALLYDYAVRLVQKKYGTLAHLHQAILEAYGAKCRLDWPSGPNDGYFLMHLREHLIAAGRGFELADLLHDLRWLETKNEAGLVFDLPNDFEAAQHAIGPGDSRYRVLVLLTEGLRREAHFIHRHRHDYPQGLFQTMWNTCWWHDSGEVKNYLSRGSAPDTAPITAGPLSTLLETWKVQREQRTPGFYWVRDIRPPSLPLGSSQFLVCRGHLAKVNSVAFSLDGRRIGSASNDNTARI